MLHDDLSYLTDILEAAKLVTSFVHDIEEDIFHGDVMRQSAVIRQIEIIGEATKRLSSGFRDAHPKIPWRQMAGMRDILIHAYNHVDVVEVWNTVTIAVPALIQEIESILSCE